MSDYQTVTVTAVDVAARSIRLRIVETHPDGACVGAIWDDSLSGELHW